jgi:hypothetical protein
LGEAGRTGGQLDLEDLLGKDVEVGNTHREPGVDERPMSDGLARGPRVSSGREDIEVPPAVSCAACRRPECPGCTAASLTDWSENSIPWEGEAGGWSERLWTTALASSTRPLQTFGSLPAGAVLPALVFALLSELVAIGSFAGAVATGTWILAPTLWWELVSTPVLVAVGFGVVLSCSVSMVVLHAMWGVALELGASSEGAAFLWRQGLRFGLYACGWDLLTSPAGVVHGVLTRGWRRAWGPIGAAVRVPRTALRAYLEDNRKLSRAAQRVGMRSSVVVLGGAVLSFAAVTLLFLVQASRWVGF